MKTNQSNDSFQSVRVFCSKAKTRLLLIAFLVCLGGGSTWAQSPIDVTLRDALIRLKASVAPGLTPIVVLTPVAKPGPTPLGPPIFVGGAKPKGPWQTDPPMSDPINGRR